MKLAEIITIGDELLIGQVVDTNSAFLATELNKLGIQVVQITSISDSCSHIMKALDDAINRAVLEDNLVEDGADVTMVGNGREAVERIRRDGGDAYDIVLMDVQMPDMDGYAATRLILELAPNLPVVGQTAHAFGEERDKCFAAGMVGHIAKPIDPEALARVVLRFAAAKRGDRPVDDSLAASPGLAL